MFIYMVSFVVVLHDAVQSFQVGRKLTFFVPLNDLIPLEEHVSMYVCLNM